MVGGRLPGEPEGMILHIYISRDAAVLSTNRNLSAEALLDKTATGIVVEFPLSEKRHDVYVGEVIPYYIK